MRDMGTLGKTVPEFCSRVVSELRALEASGRGKAFRQAEMRDESRAPDGGKVEYLLAWR